MSDESIFAAALGKAPGPERRAFLDEACSGDEALRRRVERLLEADDRTAGILERGPDGLTDPHEPPGERPGDRVGPYKLFQQIGEGGMGIVYTAEQTEPVRRRVALKIIKPGMNSRQVFARFEAERQALALMDHPNIARVLEAGVTDSGRPYFVMELVQGVPITQFCDDRHLTPRERLELLVPVCQARDHPSGGECHVRFGNLQGRRQIVPGAPRGVPGSSLRVKPRAAPGSRVAATGSRRARQFSSESS
jgi:hypothetical protein